MADDNKMVLAQKVFDNMCSYLDRRNWHYEKHSEDLMITFSVSGDDLPMDFVLAVDSERQLMRLFSRIPVTVPEDKRMDLAIATCVASNGLADGSFDYDIATGKISFRLTASFRGSDIGDGLFEYLIGVSGYTVDQYNDRFFSLSKGVMSITDFIAAE